uniref:Ubiquitin-like domain-containing protein n=1 Tax=Helicotheca tamesis TaxID=374047 RepID=A0A7S2N0G5_9STRA|mmetsp:Transcript_7012/g.9488  ORF Transcript_7012/g.9488 Transcript_7012/m.9488 type:complete len:301 (+) Transcript_7012:64-966(+)
MRNRSLISALSSALLVLLYGAIDTVVEGSKPFNVKVTLRGKRYTIPNVSTVRELQKGVEEQAGLTPAKQGVLFGGKKLKPSDVLEDMGVEDGSLINIVPTSSKKKSSSSSSSAAGAASAAAASVGVNGDVSAETSSSPTSGGGAPGGGNFMADMLKESGIDSDQLDELMKMMPGGGAGGEEGGMPSMQESMKMMQEMMSSPLFQEYMKDPEKLEQSRQMILQNPLMKSMMAGMPGFDEILNDEVKWRETMIAAADMYQQMGSSLMNGLGEDGGMGGLGGAPGGMGSFGGMSALDELSEGE